MAGSRRPRYLPIHVIVHVLESLLTETLSNARCRIGAESREIRNPSGGGYPRRRVVV